MKTSSPTPDAILQTAFGFWNSKVLLTAVTFDLFSTLGQGRLTGVESAKSFGCTHVALRTSSTRSSQWNFSNVRAMAPRQNISIRRPRLCISTAVARAISAESRDAQCTAVQVLE